MSEPNPDKWLLLGCRDTMEGFKAHNYSPRYTMIASAQVIKEIPPYQPEKH
jgi:hypothetical protein